MTLTLLGVDVRCGDDVVEAKLEWRPRGAGDSPRAGSTLATADGDVWSAEMPLPDDGVRGDEGIGVEHVYFWRYLRGRTR